MPLPEHLMVSILKKQGLSVVTRPTRSRRSMATFEDAVKGIESYHGHTRFMKKYFYRFAKSFAKIGLDPFKCKHCGITEHNGQPILMDIDHINGDHHDGRLSNLRFLCPNCHSQTDTFKNRRSTVAEIFEEKVRMCVE